MNVFFKKKGLLVNETSSVVSSRNENDENTEIFQMKFLDQKKLGSSISVCVCVCVLFAVCNWVSTHNLDGGLLKLFVFVFQ